MSRLQQRAKALGSDVSLTLRVDQDEQAKPLFQALWAQISTFEKRFSRFLDASELTKFNRAAGAEVKLSPAFLELLKACKQAAQLTGGLYNPFILPALQRAGYRGSWPAPQSYDTSLQFDERQSLPTADKLVLTAKTAQMPADSALDFGGIGKGYLLDQLADWLDTQHVKHYWLSIGGDIVCRGFDEDQRPWKIGIASATDADSLIDFISNQSGERLAIATSGTTKRRGPNWHHIIDPRTGLAAKTDILTATLVNQTATMADVYAKCLVIVGAQATESFILNKHIRFALIQIQHAATITTKTYGDKI